MNINFYIFQVTNSVIKQRPSFRLKNNKKHLGHTARENGKFPTIHSNNAPAKT